MSLLRQVLRKQAGGASPDGKPGGPKKSGYAGSIKSVASAKTVAASIASFYTAVTLGGTRIPKRRRAPKSELGRPVFVSKDPPLPELPAGVEASPVQEIPTATHVKTMNNRKDEPVLSLLMHNFSAAEDGRSRAVYTRNATITGEVRLVVTKPDPIESIDVWIGLKSGCSVVASEPWILKLNATLWTPKHGDPRQEQGSRVEPYKDMVQPGTYVFPFSFEPLPDNIKILQEEKKSTTGRGITLIPLPPSYLCDLTGWYGRISYEVGVDVLRRKLLHDPYHLDTRFNYHPNFRLIQPTEPLPPFPLIPTREDWPYEREIIGGWSITPFGGRGRWNLSTMIEVEGLLGIRHPCTAYPGDELEVVLMLWSPNSEALAELSKPESIELSFVRTNVLGVDALSPSSRTRKNRLVWPRKHVAGRLWPEGEAPISPTNSKPGTSVPEAQEGEKENGALALGVPEQSEGERPPSPAGSFEDDMFPGAADAENVVKLTGSVPVALSSGPVGPSFRYKNIAAEYLVQLLIRHKNYNHISPFGPGIEGEAPVWVVSGPRPGLAPNASPVERKMYGDNAVPVPVGSFQAPTVVGTVTTRCRERWDEARIAGI
ncbi:hypothetical protein RhiJN_09939 [Ceratobasidium sp. AG-Ba]|nr:hypothetical protein RhiJN_09939 [Ceratobasidium sp. AG-Ba]QRW10701.1 hypothetical protein RhiLY_09700 [Ceratobasidium sp. AG-Ba]